MSLLAKLYLDKEEYHILDLRMNLIRGINPEGDPTIELLGNTFDVELESTKGKILLDRIGKPNILKDVRIEIISGFSNIRTRIIDLKDVYCKGYSEQFPSISGKPVSIKFRLSPGAVYENR